MVAFRVSANRHVHGYPKDVWSILRSPSENMDALALLTGRDLNMAFWSQPIHAQLNEYRDHKQSDPCSEWMPLRDVEEPGLRLPSQSLVDIGCQWQTHYCTNRALLRRMTRRDSLRYPPFPVIRRRGVVCPWCIALYHDHFNSLG